MARPRTGTAFERHGAVVLAISMRPDVSPRRFVIACPPRPDGVKVDLRYARAVAAELQRRYDGGTWDPLTERAVPTLPSSVVTAEIVPADGLVHATPVALLHGYGKRAHRIVGAHGSLTDHAREWIKKQRYESAPKDSRRIELYIARSPIADVALGELRPRDVLTFIEWLREHPSARGGVLAPRTVRSAYDVLRRALDDAVIDELIRSNPCAPIRGRLPSVEDKDPVARQGWLFSVDEARKLMTAPNIKPVRRVSYAIQFYTGCRVGELAVLRWKDYDPTTEPLGRLTIARAKKSVTAREAQTKTSAVKLVPVHPVLATVLDAWKVEGWPERMGREPVPDDLIVPNQFDQVRNTNRHNRDFKRDCKRIGIPPRHTHAVRHAFITHVQDCGGDGNVIRWITHAPPRTAFDSYTRGQWTRLCEELSKLSYAPRRPKRRVVRAQEAPA